MENKYISIKEAARIMSKSEQFVRVGFQRGTLSFGIAQIMPKSHRYSYYISPKLFYNFVDRNQKDKFTNYYKNIDKYKQMF